MLTPILQPSEEEEIVDLMVMKLGSLFGLKCKKQGNDGRTERKFSSSNRLSTMSSDGWYSTVKNKVNFHSEYFVMAVAASFL